MRTLAVIVALVVMVLLAGASASGTSGRCYPGHNGHPDITVCHHKHQHHCLWVEGRAHWQ
jgi:hypothetical protein